MVKVDLDIYGCKVLFTTSKVELTSKYAEMFGDDLEDLDLSVRGISYFSSDKSPREYLVGVFDGEIQTLVHEVGHVAIQCAEDTGWPINFDTGEPFCYMLDYIFGQCMDGLKKENSKKPKDKQTILS